MVLQVSKQGNILCIRNGITYRMAPDDGKRAIERRLRKIVELAVEVGRQEGLIGNHEITCETEGIEGGNDVAD